MTTKTLSEIERAVALALRQPQPTDRQIAEAIAPGVDAIFRRHGGSADLVGVTDGVATFSVSLTQALEVVNP